MEVLHRQMYVDDENIYSLCAAGWNIGLGSTFIPSSSIHIHQCLLFRSFRTRRKPVRMAYVCKLVLCSQQAEVRVRLKEESWRMVLLVMGIQVLVANLW